MENAPLRYGIVGPGQIAAVFAESLAESGEGRVSAVFGRSAERLAAFCQRTNAEPHSSLQTLVESPDVDAVYIATPHTLHAEAVRAALDAGKPVLCEKPLTTSAAEARSLWDHAARTGTPLFEAWMYRCQPQIEWCLDVLKSEVLGRPLKIESRFSFEVPFEASHRLFDPKLGGGGILDVGGYPVSFALAVERAIRGHTRDNVDVPVARPDIARVSGVVGPSGVDHHAEATLQFGDGEEPFVAEIAVSLDRFAPPTTTITCEQGVIVLADPYLPGGERRGKAAEVAFVLAGSLPETKVVRADLDPFAAEAQAFRKWIERGESAPIGSAPWPMVGRDESILIAEILEGWRAQVAGLAFR
ncbi:MAG: Gfo/Idh/MocA family oxidoreductase [Planctomycetota bacterium]